MLSSKNPNKFHQQREKNRNIRKLSFQNYHHLESFEINKEFKRIILGNYK